MLQFTEAGAFIRRLNRNFTYVLGIACDGNGNVYVLDRGDSKIKAFDATGAFTRDWGGVGTADGLFNLANRSETTMLAVDRNNEIYACDPGNTRVQVFDASGAFLRRFGEAGSLPSQFSSGTPYGIVAMPNRQLYILGSPIKVFDPQGQFLQVRNLSATSSKGASSGDGLFFGVYDGYGYEYGYDQISDSTRWFESASLFRFPDGVACTARGDLYFIFDKLIRVQEREYSDVHNTLLPNAIPHPLVLGVTQRPGTTLLDIDFRVTDADSSQVSVYPLAFIGGNNTLSDVVPMRTFMEGTESRVGAGVAANQDHRVTWDMAADWSVDFAQIQVEVLAKDERNPLGVHWITVPAENGQPAVQVSRKPVTDADLQHLWYWYAASGQSGTIFTNGMMQGVSGIYTGRTLASGTTTTQSGRLFACESLGVRPIYPVEIARANAGSYGFTSVDGNSVVRQPPTVTGMVRGWGYNGSGQTGGGNVFFSSTAAKVWAGGSHSLILNTDGSLLGVGANANGELGDGSTSDRLNPVLIATNVVDMAAGSGHTLFVLADGSLWATGYNSYGQLGDGTTTARNRPVQVATGVAKVTAGRYHSLFVKNDGTLWTMGYNDYGQLGDGTTVHRNTPVQIATGVQSASGGYNHSVFVKTDGTLWAVGYNGHGQLGDGSTNNRSSPLQVASDVSQVEAGYYHTLFLRTDGTLMATGDNGSGQLGDGTTTNRFTPVQVATGVAAISAGNSFSLYTLTDGSLWAMGYNGNGQLGDGTTTHRSTPVRIGSSRYSAISAGGAHSLGIQIP